MGLRSEYNISKKKFSSSALSSSEPLQEDPETDTSHHQTEEHQNQSNIDPKYDIPDFNSIWSSIDELKKRMHELSTFQIEKITLSESVKNFKEDYQKKM